MPQDKILRALREHTELLESIQKMDLLKNFVQQVVEVFHQGGKLLVFGSGSLRSVAGLTANNFLHRLLLERPLLPAISLDDPVLTASLARDGQIQQAVPRQIRALASASDLVLGFCDSHRDEAAGDSFSAARQLGCSTAAVLLGRDDPPWELPDFLFRLQTESPSRGMEAALFFGNLLCELVEGELFGI